MIAGQIDRLAADRPDDPALRLGPRHELRPRAARRGRPRGRRYRRRGVVAARRPRPRGVVGRPAVPQHPHPRRRLRRASLPPAARPPCPGRRDDRGPRGRLARRGGRSARTPLLRGPALGQGVDVLPDGRRPRDVDLRQRRGRPFVRAGADRRTLVAHREEGRPGRRTRARRATSGTTLVSRSGRSPILGSQAARRQRPAAASRLAHEAGQADDDTRGATELRSPAPTRAIAVFDGRSGPPGGRRPGRSVVLCTAGRVPRRIGRPRQSTWCQRGAAEARRARDDDVLAQAYQVDRLGLLRPRSARQGRLFAEGPGDLRTSRRPPAPGPDAQQHGRLRQGAVAMVGGPRDVRPGARAVRDDRRPGVREPRQIQHRRDPLGPGALRRRGATHRDVIRALACRRSRDGCRRGLA